MEIRIKLYTLHPNITLSKGKWLFSFIVFLLLIFPYNVQSTDERGIKFTSNSDKFEKMWGNYHALIIGINDYKEWRSLKTAVKDAQVLKDVLIQQYGFEKKNVIFRKDGQATRERIIHDLRMKASNLNESDNLLIYFAGHGQLDDLTGDGFWIPVEGKLKSPSTWISHSTLKNILGSERIKGKNIVVVADSCYSGSLLRGGPSLLSLNEEKYQQKLAKVAALKSRQVISSGGVEPVADGGRDGHSLFAYYFLKALKENDREVVDLENLFHTRVWKPVTEIGDQRPNIGRLKTPMDEDGQFVLTNKALATAKALARENERLKQLERERHELEQLKLVLKEKEKLLKDDSKNKEKEKQNVASIPKSQIRPKDSHIKEKKYTLAILPFDVKNHNIFGQAGVIYGGGEIRIHDRFLDSTINMIDNYKNVKLTHSHYRNEKLKKRKDIQFLISDKDRNIINQMWHRKFFGTDQPNINFILEYGKKIGVDLVLVCKLAIYNDYTNTTSYLVNINSKKVYTDHIKFKTSQEIWNTSQIGSTLKILRKK